MARWDDAIAAAVKKQRQESDAREQQGQELQKRRAAEAEAKIQALEAHAALERRMRAVAAELESFLQSADGNSAMRFLLQVKKHIEIGYHSDGGGFGLSIMFCDHGFIRTTEMEGTGQLYGGPQVWAENERRRRESQCQVSSYDAVNYFTHHNRSSNKEPEGMVEWLKAEIDKLAQPYTNP